MTSFLLARVLTDAGHVLGLRFSSFEARTALALRRMGADAQLYRGRPEGQMIDLARQIARQRAETCVLLVDAAGMAAAECLKTLLSEIRPGARTIAVMHDPLGNVPNEEAVAALTPRKSPEALAIELLGQDDGSCPATHDLYSSGTLGHEDLSMVGVEIDLPVEVLALELSAIVVGGWSKPIPLHGFALGSGVVARALRMLAETGTTFDLHVDAQSVDDEALALLATSKVNRVLLRGKASDAFPLRSMNVLVDVEEAGDHARRMALYAANGTLAYESGLYLDGNGMPAIYHLELPEGHAEQQASALQVYGRNMAQKSATLRRFDVRRVGIRSRAPTPWPPHSYAIGMDETGLESLLVNEDPKPAKTIRRIGMAQLPSEPPVGSETLLVTIDDAHDVATFESRLALLQSEGVALIDQPSRSVVFANGCRWLGPSACQVGLLRRVRVAADGAISSCDPHRNIGQVGEPYDRLVSSVRRTAQMEQVRRSCVSCVARDECSKCSQLPSQLSGRYCEVRQAYPALTLLLELRGLLHMLNWKADASTQVRLRVSAGGLPVQLLSEGGEHPARAGSRPVIVFMPSGEIYAWTRGTRRIARISEAMALIIEGWWTSCDGTVLAKALSDRFSVNLDEARDGLRSGQARLRAGGLIDA